MLTSLRQSQPEGCISDLEFDQWRADELEQDEAARLEAHLETCSRCQQRHAALNRAATAFLERFPSIESLAAGSDPVRRGEAASQVVDLKTRRMRAWTLGSMAAGVLAAAAFFLLVKPVTPPERTASPEAGEGTRLKGSSRLGFFVKRGSQVLLGVDGQVVHPGDRLRFTVSAMAPEQLAIFSLDGAGVASVYFPAGAESAPVGRGMNQPLESSVELDATLGREHLWAVFCNTPFRVEPLRERLEREGKLAEPAGCTSETLAITKASLP